jgi:hypothetical protein
MNQFSVHEHGRGANLVDLVSAYFEQVSIQYDQVRFLPDLYRAQLIQVRWSTDSEREEFQPQVGRGGRDNLEMP